MHKSPIKLHKQVRLSAQDAIFNYRVAIKLDCYVKKRAKTTNPEKVNKNKKTNGNLHLKIAASF